MNVGPTIEDLFQEHLIEGPQVDRTLQLHQRRADFQAGHRAGAMEGRVRELDRGVRGALLAARTHLRDYSEMKSEFGRELAITHARAELDSILYVPAAAIRKVGP